MGLSRLSAVSSRTKFSDLAEPIAAWFAGHDGLLDDTITPRILHMDLHRSNILVSAEQITGIVDVEESVIGHNEYDLMRLELAHFGDGEDALREAFFHGYGAHMTLDTGYDRRRPFYEMSRMLVGLRCLALFGSSGPEETRRVRTRVYELLDL